MIEEQYTMPAYQQTSSFILRVNSGVSAGQSFELPALDTLLCGSALDNDILIANADHYDWQVSVHRQSSEIRLRVLRGTVVIDDAEVTSGQEFMVRENTIITAGPSTFSLHVPMRTQMQDKGGTIKTTIPMLAKRVSEGEELTRKLLYGFSIVCVVLGVMSAMYAVTGSLILVNADTNPSNSSNFMEVIGTSELNHLEVEQIEESNRFAVQGTLKSREQKILLQQMAKTSNAVLELDVRIDDLIAESIEDIFRVNGIPANADVLPDGEVKIHTRTAEQAKLEELRQKIRSDLPSLTQFEIINTEPPIVKPKKKTGFTPSPEKRITLISAGRNAYIMTEDKSRYFVGALLPSGHLVEAINEGEVIVSKNGTTERLKY